MDLDLNQIVKMDEVNMSDILEKSGSTFSYERRLKALRNELDMGSVIISDADEGVITGYVQYLPKAEGEIYIVSLQILPKYRDGVVLRRLLNKLKDDLINKNVSSLTSSVHKNNVDSIRLNKIIGFEETDSINGSVRFLLNGEKLTRLLKK